MASNTRKPPDMPSHIDLGPFKVGFPVPQCRSRGEARGGARGTSGAAQEREISGYGCSRHQCTPLRLGNSASCCTCTGAGGIERSRHQPRCRAIGCLCAAFVVLSCVHMACKPNTYRQHQLATWVSLDLGPWFRQGFFRGYLPLVAAQHVTMRYERRSLCIRYQPRQMENGIRVVSGPAGLY
jgi:hypothetical protein